MMTEILPEPRDFSIKDATSYDSLTAEFDLFTSELSKPLAARLVSLARLAPAERVLDIGTGTGVVALQAGEQVGPGGKIVGIDLSWEMLRTAASNARRAGLGERIEYARMNAEALGVARASFDCVLSLFALLHFPNPLAALGEMFRALRPGGRLVLAVGSGPPLLSRAAFDRGLKRLRNLRLQRQGRLLTAPGFLVSLASKHLSETKDPLESKLASHSSNRTGSVISLVRKAGFTKIERYWEGHDKVVENAEKFWDLQRTFSSVARKKLLGAPQDKIKVLRRDFFEECRKVQAAGGKLEYPFGAFFVKATRPR